MLWGELHQQLEIVWAELEAMNAETAPEGYRSPPPLPILPFPARCRWCWLCWAVATAGAFGWLETVGYRRECHPTLSRQLKRLLGARGSWVFAAAGAVLSWHLNHLTDPGDGGERR